jgi:hypothetical protein
MSARRRRAEAELVKVFAEIDNIRMDTLKIEAEMHRAAITFDIAVEKLRLELERNKRDAETLDPQEEGT